MNAFDTQGWHVRVRLGEGRARCLEYSGADADAAKALLHDMRPPTRDKDAGSLMYRWHEREDYVVFQKVLEEGAELEGAIFLSKDCLRQSNVIGEYQTLSLIAEYFLMTARRDLSNSEAAAFQYFSDEVSLSLLIVSRDGEILIDAGGGLSFVESVLSTENNKLLSLQRKIECALSKFEQTAERIDGQSRQDTRSDTSSATRGDTVPYRIIRLEGEPSHPSDGGPYYAIVEAKEIQLPDAGDLCDRYELTPAEARVVGCMMEGAAVPKISSDLHLTDHTVRTYLKRSYNKIGVNGQAQMISKLTRLSCSLGRLPKSVSP